MSDEATSARDGVLRCGGLDADALGDALDGTAASAVVFDDPPTRAHLDRARAHAVDRVVITLHGARREVHEHHAAPASHGATIAALTSARGLGLTVDVRTAVTRSSMHVLDELPGLLRARRVARWLLVLPTVGEASDGFTRVLPRLGLAAPRALRATERAAGLGLTAQLVGFPRCVAGRLADRVTPVAAPHAAFGAPCEGCAAREACAGLEPAYLERFGVAELRRLSAVPPVPAADPIAAAAAFDWREL